MTVRMGLRGIPGSVLLALALVVLPTSWALASSSLELDPGRVAWSRLLLRAADARADVRIEVRLSQVPAAGLASVPAADLGGAVEPLEWRGSADLYTVANANAYFVLEPGADKAAGDEVRCLIPER